MLFPLPKDEAHGSNWKRPGINGGFGADRGHGRLHAGCDIGAKDGVRVIAIDSGKVVERGDKPFIPGTHLFAIAVKHSSGIVARYTEINNIPVHLAVGTEVSAGETLGVVAFQGKGSMLHFELYKGDRKGFLSLPSVHWPRGMKGKHKKPDEMTELEKTSIRTAGYLPDFTRRNDLLDPTEFLLRLEKGETFGDNKAALIALGVTFLHNPVLGILQAAALASAPSPGEAAMGMTAAVEPDAGRRAYSGVIGIAYEGPTRMSTPIIGHPRDYYGPTDIAMPEPE